LALEPLENALRALAASAFFAFPTAVVSLIFREGWTPTVVLVAVLNALLLVVGAVLLVT